MTPVFFWECNISFSLLTFNSVFLFFFVSDNIEGDVFRKMKDKRPSAGSTAGQILPVISDKSSHVTQVQGSRQDQIGNLRIKQRCTGISEERYAHCLQAVMTFATIPCCTTLDPPASAAATILSL